MSKTEREVIRHAKEYKPHKLGEENLRQKGKEPEEKKTNLHINQSPLQLTEVHIKLFWKERKFGRRG